MAQHRGLAVMVASMAMWGMANPFSDLAMDGLTPAQTYITEVTAGGGAFVLMVAALPRLRPSLRRVPWRLAVPLGLIMPGLCFYLGNVGYDYGTVTTGVILLSTEAIFTALGGMIMLHEHMPARAAGAILSGFAGAVVVGVAGQQHNPEALGTTFTVLGTPLPAGIVGAVAFVLSALFSGLFAVLVRRHAATTDVIGLTVGQLVAAVLLAAVLLVALRVDMAQAYAATTSFWAAVVSGLLGSAFAFLMFNYASQHVPTRHTAMSLNLIPVVAIVVGAVLGRGLPTPVQMVGAAVVLASLLALDTVATGTPAAVPPH